MACGYRGRTGEAACRVGLAVGWLLVAGASRLAGLGRATRGGGVEACRVRKGGLAVLGGGRAAWYRESDLHGPQT